MDDDLVGGSTAAAGDTPTAENAAPSTSDWNTSLAAPAVGSIAGGGTADATPEASAEGTPTGRRGRVKPEWRDPSELPAVQRAHTGTFGEKLAVLKEATAAVTAVLQTIEVTSLSDAEVVALTQTVEGLGRPVDAGRVSTAAVVADRSRRGLGNESMAWRLGAKNDNDLLALLTNASIGEMKRRAKLGDRVTKRVDGGVVREPDFPRVAAALKAGELGIDSAERIVEGLAEFTRHGRWNTDPADFAASEQDLVMHATGSVWGRDETTTDGSGTTTTSGSEGPVRRLGDSAEFTQTADKVRELTARHRAYLNPDGAPPNDTTTDLKSHFSFGSRRDDGLYPIRGAVTPELKGIISTVFDSYLSARSTPSFPSAEEQAWLDAGELIPCDLVDDRNGAQKRADILRGIFSQAAQNPLTPQMGGMPPTVMVHVNITDLLDYDKLSAAGFGWIDGVDAPISMATVQQMIDTGGMQPVFIDKNGAVTGLGSKTRRFTPMQRKVITARDGGCAIPGCSCPPQWTEVHHVIPWQYGGPTEITNGVLLCWYHHRTIDKSGWQIRMVGGVPQVKAPVWLDNTQQWRPAGQHRANQSRRTA